MRSFCATARQGSLTAAAAALDLAQPTVWKQVHALEQAFGSKLVEPHVRGCRPTEAGEVLRRLLEPSVANLDLEALRIRFAGVDQHAAVSAFAEEVRARLAPWARRKRCKRADSQA